MQSVNVILNQWGRWSVRNHDSGIGWPGVASGFGAMQQSSGGRAYNVWAVASAEMERVDRAVNGLPDDLRLAVIVYYRFAQSFRKAALMIGQSTGAPIDHKTVQRRILRAQMTIADALGLRLADAMVGGR